MPGHGDREPPSVSIPTASGSALAPKTGASNLRHSGDAMAVPGNARAGAALRSAETFPHLTEVLAPQPGALASAAKVSLLPGKSCCPWPAPRRLPARLPRSHGTPRLGACVSVRLSPLATFQESRHDLRAADSAS